VFVPRTPEDFDDPATPSVNEGYDLDGNQLRDGRWNYTWDGENLLTKLESLANAPSGSKRRLEFEYDWQGRRIKKKVTNLDTSSVLLDNKFLYDSWNLIAELNVTNNAVIRSYMWGLDLSGSVQGAGGVGGLLEVNDSANGAHFAAYDGNGNVAALVKGTDGTISAQYEYGPFAEPIRVTGPMGKTNPIRFSSKYTDDESDVLYYGKRYYNPSTGRWLNRDPIGELGGANLYTFSVNEPLIHYDSFGKKPKVGFYFPDYLEYPGAPLDIRNCGGFFWVIAFILSEPTSEGGYIIQKVEASFDVEDCTGKKLDVKAVTANKGVNSLDPAWFPLWEAFEVPPNSGGPNSQDGFDVIKNSRGKLFDAFSPGLTPFGCQTRGRIEYKGTAEFFEGIKLPANFRPTNKPPTGSFPITKTPPNLIGGTGQITRSINAEWDCCCECDNSTKTKTKIKIIPHTPVYSPFIKTKKEYHF
jgi:RHS repeat-associated protein